MLARKLLGTIAVAALAVAHVASPASADLVVNGGSLGFDGVAPTVDDFTPITLNGMPQLTTLTIDPFTVEDSTGLTDGWHVLLTVPDLVNAAYGGHTILASTITMQAPTVTAVAPSDITNVAGNATAGNLDSGEKIVVAADDAGMGMYAVSPQPLKVVVPVDAHEGTYVSAGTIAVVSGP